MKNFIVDRNGKQKQVMNLRPTCKRAKVVALAKRILADLGVTKVDPADHKVQLVEELLVEYASENLYNSPIQAKKIAHGTIDELAAGLYA